MADLKQKLSDLKVMLKSDRRLMALGLFIGMVLLVVVFTSKSNRQVRPAEKPLTGGPVAQGREIDEIIQIHGTAIKRQEDSIKQVGEQLKLMQRDREESEARITEILQSTIDTIEGLKIRVDKIGEAGPAPGSEGGVPTTGSLPTPPPGIEPIEGNLNGPAGVTLPPPVAPKISRAKVISVGDSVRVTLLTGVNAPVDGTPYPVVFAIKGPILGPDGAALEIGEARLVAAAQGSDSDSRVNYRLTNLAIRHKDGRRSVVKVDGWITGEDGVLGMRGKLIDKLGRLIAMTAGVSFAAALGSNLEQQNDITVVGSPGLNVNQDSIDQAASSALTDASNRLGQILLDRYEKLVPVVEVLSGREAVAIFSANAQIELCDDGECGADEEAMFTTASLD